MYLSSLKPSPFPVRFGAKPQPEPDPTQSSFSGIGDFDNLELEEEQEPNFGFSDLQTHITQAMILSGHQGADAAFASATKKIVAILDTLQPGQAKNETILGENHGNILLNVMAEKGDINTLQRCLGLGLNLAQRDGFNHNLLMLAIKGNQLENVRLVLETLEKTLSPEDLKNLLKDRATEGRYQGKNALEIAYICKNGPIIKLLRPRYQVGLGQHLKLKLKHLF